MLPSDETASDKIQLVLRFLTKPFHDLTFLPHVRKIFLQFFFFL